MKKTIYLLGFLFLISLSACGSSGSGSSTTSSSTTPTYEGTWQFVSTDSHRYTYIHH